MFNKIIKFFDKLEDHIRGFLSGFPVIYSLIGGTAIVVFWRGIWQVFDSVELLNGFNGGVISIVISVVVLLSCGLFVSFFIGDTIILSGIKKEKKMAEKTMDELQKETDKMQYALEKINNIDKNLSEIKERLDKIKNL